MNSSIKIIEDDIGFRANRNKALSKLGIPAVRTAARSVRDRPVNPLWRGEGFVSYAAGAA